MARVLVDSASEDLREILGELLELEGHSVVRAAAGDAVPAAGRIDLVIADLGGGPEREGRVRQLRLTSPAVKVVTLGTPDDPAARGDETVEHPVRSADEVLRVVRRALLTGQ